MRVCVACACPCVSACACVRVCMCACACANAMCLYACTYACVCLRACVCHGERLRLSIQSTMCSKESTSTASLSQRWGSASLGFYMCIFYLC